MTYAIEFPDFPAADLPVIPDGFADESWHNDAMPCFASDTFRIWIDYTDETKREYQGGTRFAVCRLSDADNGADAFLQTNEWREVLRAIYADVLSELAANDGACLYWQMSNPQRAESAFKSGIVTMDSDLLVHPDATQIEAGMAYAMESAS
jgi:hypothetical protein